MNHEPTLEIEMFARYNDWRVRNGYAISKLTLKQFNAMMMLKVPGTHLNDRGEWVGVYWDGGLRKP